MDLDRTITNGQGSRTKTKDQARRSCTKYLDQEPRSKEQGPGTKDLYQAPRTWIKERDHTEQGAYIDFNIVSRADETANRDGELLSSSAHPPRGLFLQCHSLQTLSRPVGCCDESLCIKGEEGSVRCDHMKFVGPHQLTL